MTHPSHDSREILKQQQRLDRFMALVRHPGTPPEEKKLAATRAAYIMAKYSIEESIENDGEILTPASISVWSESARYADEFVNIFWFMISALGPSHAVTTTTPKGRNQFERVELTVHHFLNVEIDLYIDIWQYYLDTIYATLDLRRVRYNRVLIRSFAVEIGQRYRSLVERIKTKLTNDDKEQYALVVQGQEERLRDFVRETYGDLGEADEDDLTARDAQVARDLGADLARAVPLVGEPDVVDSRLGEYLTASDD